MKNTRQTLAWGRQRPSVIAVAAAFLAAGNALAFEVDVGNPDLAVRWDNTIRYNAAQRMEARNSKIGNNYKFDEGTYSFDKGDLVANRFDLLTELDVVYKKDVGFRISAAAWYDNVYDGKEVTRNTSLSSPSSYNNNQYSSFTKRYYAGPSGELLDAFMFTNFDLGNVPVKLKAGRHTVFWGEALLLGGAMHGVSYSQMPLDLQKGFATPGVEAKELFRPLNQISAQAQLTDTLSVAGQYFLQWEAYRYPEGGTYLGPADFAFNGPDSIVQVVHPVLGALGYTRADPITPKNSGEFGLSVKWSPELLDGTLGFYYRRFADKMPQALVTELQTAAGFPLASGSRYRLIYADNIDLFGISLAKNIGGVSVGAELSYRYNTPLSAQTLGNASAFGIPAKGETYGPRGDTMHGLVNLLGAISKTPVFDAASWAAELTWAQWTKVRSGENLFNAVGYNGCKNAAGANGGDKWDGCATKNYVGAGVAFTPTWFQVLPGVDISMPMTYSVGLSGNSPTTFGGNEGLGNYSIGIGADIYQKYRVDLKYIDYFGKYRDNGTAVTTVNGFTTALDDRGFLSLTLKTSF